jgi:hypothetical protein
MLRPDDGRCPSTLSEDSNNMVYHFSKMSLIDEFYSDLGASQTRDHGERRTKNLRTVAAQTTPSESFISSLFSAVAHLINNAPVHLGFSVLRAEGRFFNFNTLDIFCRSVCSVSVSSEGDPCQAVRS